MVLAHIIDTDEDNLICDLADTYGVLNYEELPPSTVAALFLGLSDNARTKRNLAGQKLTLEQTLLAMILDGVNFLCWAKTKSATKGRNKPKSVLDLLNKNPEREYESFSTEDELMNYLNSF